MSGAPRGTAPWHAPMMLNKKDVVQSTSRGTHRPELQPHHSNTELGTPSKLPSLQ